MIKLYIRYVCASRQPMETSGSQFSLIYLHVNNSHTRRLDRFTLRGKTTALRTRPRRERLKANEKTATKARRQEARAKTPVPGATKTQSKDHTGSAILPGRGFSTDSLCAALGSLG